MRHLRLLKTLAASLVYLAAASFLATTARADSTRGELLTIHNRGYVRLEGEARGGTLIVTEGSNVTAPWITIPTKEGETAESVMPRVAAAIQSHYHNMPMEVRDGRIRGVVGQPFLFHGTESGLGIPAHPLGLSGYFDREIAEFRIAWMNPEEGDYDQVRVIGIHPSGAIPIDMRGLPSDTDHTLWPAIGTPILPNIEHRPDVSHFVVWGTRQDVPSPAGGVFVSGDTCMDILGQPYIDGIRNDKP